MGDGLRRWLAPIVAWLLERRIRHHLRAAHRSVWQWRQLAPEPRVENLAGELRWLTLQVQTRQELRWPRTRSYARVEPGGAVRVMFTDN